MNPLSPENIDEIYSVKEDYLVLTDTPDSISVKTVGTLSEVVADLGNKMSYKTELTRKELQWQTQLFLEEQGLDSIDYKEKLETFLSQTNRLLNVLENSPEALDSALVDFSREIDPLFYGLEQSISSSLMGLSASLDGLDYVLSRERVTLDSILKREREIILAESHYLVEEGIQNTMKEFRKTLRTLTFLFILIIVIVLGLPFYTGYLLGKNRKN